MGLLGNVDAIWIALGLLAAMLVAHEISFRRAGRVRRESAGDEDEPSTGLESAVSLLLGLLLAFSFSMAAGRYEQRQDLVIAEANAIGTAWLRCDLLAPDAGQACRRGLREYTDLRLAIYEAPDDPAVLADLVGRSQRSLDALWRVVAEQAVAAPSPNGSLAVQAMNDVIDRHGERIAAYRRHVPDEVILMLLGLCLAWAAFTGHAQGWMGRRYRLGWPVFAVLVALVVFITFDFDRQKRGFIRLDATQSLYDLRDSMGP
ncbi:hypothetical protein [Arenimonas sp.]|uniref:bestrophin-like domain n=1 Tax=Arenimonas sp. TaxID=1872635 RepID=UPI002E34FC97|nr:hypothetical protein [Arenimonas sp.]HEX4853516.1 hypothetical protein [Arenimonas sp.]